MFWDYVSNFWDNLTDDDKGSWENFWQGLDTASRDLITKSNRFKNVTSLTNDVVVKDCYDIAIGVLSARKTNLDPTIKNPNNIIKPLGTLVLEPTDGLFRDCIEITAGDYYRVRDIGLGQFVVVGDKYFKITNLLSSEESCGRQCSVDITKDGCGIIGIRSDVDFSNFVILVSKNGSDPIVVTWHPTGLEIRAGLTSTVDEIVAAANLTPGWGHLYNKNALIDVAPTLNAATDTFPGSAIIARKLPNFIELELDTGRFCEPQAKVWKYYPGYSTPAPRTDDNGFYVFEKMKYLIQVDGSLAYLGNDQFNFYLTNGLVFDIDKGVTSLPFLVNYVDSPDDGIEYFEGKDYLFYNNMIEFSELPIVEDTFFCNDTAIMEAYMYEMYGNLVGMRDWETHHHDNVSGKAAIHGLMKFNQSIDDFEKSMNLYYGLPIAPENCEVVGLYESFGYKVIQITQPEGVQPAIIRLEIVSDLHPFIYDGCEMLLEPETNVSVLRVVDRVLGTLEVYSLEGIVLGSKLYPKLVNRYQIVEFPGAPGGQSNQIKIYGKDRTPFAHLIKTMYDIEHRYPEVLIYDCDEKGVYHITVAGTDGTYVYLQIYLPVFDTLYNDHVIMQRSNVNTGSMHLLWPTHKFLYLKLESGLYYKAYVDAPIDTIFDTGDKLSKFDIICRNVSMKKFPGWNEFNYFRRQSGINHESDLVQMTSAIPGAKFGKYFPSGYTTNNLYAGLR